jgi:hypothetical protein
MDCGGTGAAICEADGCEVCVCKAGIRDAGLSTNALAFSGGATLLMDSDIGACEVETEVFEAGVRACLRAVPVGDVPTDVPETPCRLFRALRA